MAKSIWSVCGGLQNSILHEEVAKVNKSDLDCLKL